MEQQYQRRFSGVKRLYGEEGLERLRQASVCVVGLGGVGSWVVEALTRSGVGGLTLVDMDDVCISNVNRQLHAVNSELGKPKVEAMERRVHSINPECVVDVRQAFFLKSNATEILNPAYDYVVDAIDSPSLKAHLIACCKERGIPVITTGGAGGRRNPANVQVIDLAYTSNDRLLAYVRRILRSRHGFPRGDRAFKVECVVSTEQVVYAQKDGSVCAQRQTGPDLRLDCDTGFGTASFVTGTFGFIAASRVVEQIASGKTSNCQRGATSPSVCLRSEPNSDVKLASTLAASSAGSIPVNSVANS